MSTQNQNPPNEVLRLRERTPEEEARIAAEWEQREKAERQERELERRRRWAACGIPSKDVRRIAAGELESTPALSATREFERKRTIVLVLAGPVGCGKTTAAARWLTQSTSRGTYLEPYPRRFLAIAELARLNRFNAAAMEPVEQAAALVVDDLGAEFLDDKGGFASLFDAVMDARYRHLLPTVITTNLRSDEFRARYGERTVDRLREHGQFVELAGKSLRTSER
ncbi:MAG: ATP-binding protein [Proteobacteria bacterium]|nr:ATP-binding protein [Pseudomonadota bacterium]